MGLCHDRIDNLVIDVGIPPAVAVVYDLRQQRLYDNIDYEIAQRIVREYLTVDRMCLFSISRCPQDVCGDDCYNCISID